MDVVAFVHDVHGFGLHMKGRHANGGEDKHLITIKSRWNEIHLFNLQRVII